MFFVLFFEILDEKEDRREGKNLFKDESKTFGYAKIVL